MARFQGGLAALALTMVVAGCQFIPGMGGGAAAGGFKPAECMSTQFTGDLADAKVGRSMTYVTEAGGSKTSQTVKIVGKDGDDWMIEQWMDAGSMVYGLLFKVGTDKKIKEAWAAAKDEKSWTKIAVKDPPQAPPPGDAPKPKIKESDEKKEVKAGSFNSHRLDVTVTVQGKEYNSLSWFSKDVWKLYTGAEHGGLVAMEGSGAKTTLEAKSEDAKPTLELPKK